MRRILAIGLVLAMALMTFAVIGGNVSATVTIYANDRPGWESAVGLYDEEFFTDATLNPGVSVVTDVGYVDTNKGVWWDRLIAPQYGETTTTWQFAEPIVGFGGNWDTGTPGGPGTSIEVEIDGSWITVGEIPNSYTGEFWGFVSTTPFSSVLLSSGSTSGWCETYELDNMVYSTYVPELYAGGSDPGVVYKYTGGTSWDVISPELGYAVLDLIEYEGHLYAATMSTSNPQSGVGRVWRWDGGMTWALVGDNLDDQVCALAVYQGNLYAGTAWNGMKLYRYNGDTSWTQVISNVIWSGTRSLYVSNGFLLMGDIGYDRFARIDASETFTVERGQMYGSCIYDYQDYGDHVYASAYVGRLWKTYNLSWVEILGIYDGNMWELETYHDLLYMSYNNGELRASDVPDRGDIVYNATDGIISMTTDPFGVNLYFGTGGEAGALYGSSTSGIAGVYRYDGTSVELISAVDEMVTGVQVLYVVQNLAPFADAGGPYEADEGSGITFDASGSSDAEDDVLEYRWYIDGAWTGWSSSPTAAYTWYDDYSGTVTVEVDDGEYISSHTTSVTVNNVDPSVSIDSVVQPFSEFILPGDVLEFYGSFTDPGSGDTHTIEWNFGDFTTATGTLTPTHAFAAAGIYGVTLTVTDDDTGEGTDIVNITVLSGEEAAEEIDDYIQDLPDDNFKEPAEQRKNALHEKLIENEDGDAVIQLIEAGFYEEALEKLQNDIRPKCDGDPDPEDWIIDEDAQDDLMAMIDWLIDYLETLI